MTERYKINSFTFHITRHHTEVEVMAGDKRPGIGLGKTAAAIPYPLTPASPTNKS